MIAPIAKRIAFLPISNVWPWQGQQELWGQTALRLKEQGHAVAVSMRDVKTVPAEILSLQKAGAEIFARRPLKSDRWSRIKRRIAAPPSDLDIIRNWAPDLVVISHDAPVYGLEWDEQFAKAGVPFAVIHQTNSGNWWPTDSQIAILRIVCQQAKAIFCVSEANLETLRDETCLDLPNAQIVRNPYKVNRARALSLPWPSVDGLVRAACVARFDPANRGQDLLIKALANEKWRDRPFHVSFYGGSFSVETVKKLAERFDVRNVSFEGFIKDVESIWRENHLLVLPARTAGLPTPLVEASLCGRPSVVTAVGGNTELCVDGQTGFVAKAPTVFRVDEALERAWENRADWRRLGQAARDLASRGVPDDPVGEFAGKLVGLASRLEAIPAAA